jgi:hypothetical protein
METDPDPTPEGNPDCANCKRAKSGCCKQHMREAIAAGAEPPKRGPGRPANKAKLAEDIRDGYVTIAVMVSSIPHPAAQGVGLSIGANAAQIGESWAELADRNPKVAQALRKLQQTSAVGMVVAAHMPILLTALVVTNSLPPELAAVLGPSFGVIVQQPQPPEA